MLELHFDMYLLNENKCLRACPAESGEASISGERRQANKSFHLVFWIVVTGLSISGSKSHSAHGEIFTTIAVEIEIRKPPSLFMAD